MSENLWTVFMVYYSILKLAVQLPSILNAKAMNKAKYYFAEGNLVWNTIFIFD